MEKKILKLHIKDKHPDEPWFTLIKDGVKDEEYREMKEYWLKRLFDIVNPKEALYIIGGVGIAPKPFTRVLFINGYYDESPRIEKEIVSITIGYPKKGLCPKEFLNKEYYIIKFK